MRLLQLRLGWTFTTLCVIAISFGVLPEKADAAWLTGWDYRKSITIDDTNVDSDLSAFPLYVKISNDTDLTNATSSTGADIRFTSSTGVLLSYEKEEFTVSSGSGSGHFWVKVPDVSSSTGTVIYLYYGGADKTDGEDAENTWEANFKGVWHMGDSTDSSGNGNSLSAVDSPTGGATGKISNSYDFDGGGSAFEVDPWTDVTAPPFTMSAWVECDQDGANDAWMSIADKDAIYYHSAFLAGATAGDPVLMYSYGTSAATAYSTSGYSADTWHHVVVVVVAADSRKAYIDGGNVGTDSTSSTVANIDRLRLGITADSTPAGDFDGTLDEVRISSSARTADWIKFEYNNINEADQEMTIGGVEVLKWDGGGADTNWSTAVNWVEDTVPGAGDNVLFDGTGQTNVTIDSSVTVVDFTSTDTFTGTITISSGNLLTTSNDLTLSGGTLTQEGSAEAIHTGNDFFIGSGATLNHADNSTAEVHKLVVTVSGSLTVGTGGAIDVDGLGYDARQG